MDPKFKAIIFDLGGVLLDWDRQAVTNLPRSQMQTMMNSTLWFDLERGRLTLQEASEHFGKTMGIDARTIQHSFEEAQQSLKVNTQLSQVVKELKASDEDLQLIVMSNISQEHFRSIQRLDLPWSLFDFTFASGAVGMRKPDLCFFRHVIDTIGIPPSQVVMVDDRVENICAARSVGIHGVLTGGGSSIEVGQILRNMFFDPISRADVYMKKNAGNHLSAVEGKDIVIRENFSQLLIWELTGDAEIIYLKWPSGKAHAADTNMRIHLNGNVEDGLWNFWYDEPVLTTSEFPPDADTTSTAYLSIPASHFSKMADVQLVIEKMATNIDSDGIMQTYFQKDRPRTSLEVCCNILRVFYRFGHGQDSDPRITQTQEWVVQCLRNKSYVYGTRYYSVPEAFLYFATRLYVECNHEALKRELGSIKEALLERINVPTNALALALRISSCQLLRIGRHCYKNDLDVLRSLQQEDGGWPTGHIYRYGKIGAYIGNRGLATVLAAKVIRYEIELDSK
ncbi:HAD-like domain-containing protein [Annulohypoxylon truncatum]|uniref:HAD-like domain-containing protein n=1 Tax=Annulohypoxylon truncatum TaxID=327061 RepID=UPI0020087E4C|nr:HAD-like domain-containing protein [Annulohypoxylon truncatum]KAI1204847.1 HAD-like domain-containing protein [Annulohypoxylon truncatum]